MEIMFQRETFITAIALKLIPIVSRPSGIYILEGLKEQQSLATNRFETNISENYNLAVIVIIIACSSCL